LALELAGKVSVITLGIGYESLSIAKYPIADRVGLLVKYASYSADDYSVDTRKIWSMLAFTF